jgi:hypothetical protein
MLGRYLLLYRIAQTPRTDILLQNCDRGRIHLHLQRQPDQNIPVDIDKLIKNGASRARPIFIFQVSTG